MSSDLVIVYHRQPYEEAVEDGKVVRRENKSPNGIVPTLKSFFGSVDHSAWIAWKLADDPADPDFEQKIEIDDEYGQYTVSRLPLTEEQVREFYHITSKEAFWPILHAFQERYNYDPVDWNNFRDVNRRFAEAAAEEAAYGALVWVHDYNLWLVPGYLRTLRPDVRIAFFHHTPFPSADMFNALPWRREIVNSLLACDDVGFHIPRYAENFVSVANSLFDVDLGETVPVDPTLISEGTALTERTVRNSITFEGHRTAVSVCPVGVNTEYLDSVARSEDTEQKVAQIREELGESPLIISVGRTDYTKGGVQQLASFERVLEANPDLRDAKIRLMHISVSANRNMTAYAEIQAEIEQIAGRINGRFGTLDWQPVALISRALPLEELVAYYRAADVAWITPLADGMNLVCKEYIASRYDEDGALVLSEFAGSAVQLHHAVTANPYSHRAMDSAIIQALTMPPLERKGRMKKLRQAVKADDISNWRPGTLEIGVSNDQPAVA
ncbi:glucosylglycerol-phosphate synthase [Yoonia sediminilitoris]|uniref:Glucosyl-glycerol phosphate synthase n=1 Tax=Yoonia sediminilitoris TaxID=1286148 RepID=A0A2T6KMS6_9RHOB|nr:glucosylglycerol-phosphate synthase [Yoonia sediminilitoris]PUB17523.1 glucosyl-glycerol phosphate synthase [Yoonia sediminilitoris]RCW97818.1 glucosyl-glycerol phosphate synthase [Yoonia sediminilitoris]